MIRVTSRHESSTEHNAAVHPHQRFAEVCWKLGMKHEAPFGWASLHVKPHIVCVAYIFSIAGVLTANSVLYGIGLPWLNYTMHFPYMIAMVSLFCCTTLVWRFGPLIVKSTAYKSALGLFSATSAFLQVASFIGPDSCTPFSNRVVTIFGTSLAMFPGFCFTVFGGGEAEHPPEPYSSLWHPLMNAAFSTMRFMDAMTDVGFVRILLTQVRPTHLQLASTAITAQNADSCFRFSFTRGRPARAEATKRLLVVCVTHKTRHHTGGRHPFARLYQQHFWNRASVTCSSCLKQPLRGCYAGAMPADHPTRARVAPRH